MKKQRGIALFMVVIMVSLLLMLTGAFMQVNRAHFGMINNRQAQEDARAACLAAYNYTLYKLEHDHDWGKQPFAGGPDPVLGPGLVVNEEPGLSEITGQLPSRHATFRAIIDNNLKEPTGSPSGVPPGCAKITIEGSAGNSVRRVSGLIHEAPLFDSSVISRKNLTVDAQNLAIRSVDPFRNLVRAEDQISIPQVLTDHRTRFLSPNSNRPDSKGTIWSRGTIQTGDPSGGYQSIAGGNVNTANTNSGGRFVPNAEQHFQVHDLRAQDIKVPNNKSKLDSGEYRFTMANASISYTAYANSADITGHKGNIRLDIHVLEHYADPNDPQPKRVFRSRTRDDDLKDSIVIPTLLGGGIKPEKVEVDNLNINYGFPGNPPVSIGDIHNLDQGGTGTVVADLANQTVRVQPGVTVETDQDLMITSDRTDPPTLDLGTASDPPALIAGGELKLENAVTNGVGTLVALGGDVSFQPLSNNQTVSTAQDSNGLVVFANQNINMSNPIPGGFWGFRGLVYSRGDFNFDANGADSRLDGTIVSLGDLAINRANDVEFVYNPAYLDLVESNLPPGRLQIERLVWRE